MRLTQSEIEDIANEQLDESMTLVKRVLKMGKLRFMPIDTIEIRKWPIHELANEVDFVVLVGGLSKLRAFKKRLEEVFSQSSCYHVENS